MKPHVHRDNNRWFRQLGEHKMRHIEISMQVKTLAAELRESTNQLKEVKSQIVMLRTQVQAASAASSPVCHVLQVLRPTHPCALKIDGTSHKMHQWRRILPKSWGPTARYIVELSCKFQDSKQSITRVSLYVWAREQVELESCHETIQEKEENLLSKKRYQFWKYVATCIAICS